MLGLSRGHRRAVQARHVSRWAALEGAQRGMDWINRTNWVVE